MKELCQLIEKKDSEEVGVLSIDGKIRNDGDITPPINVAIHFGLCHSNQCFHLHKPEKIEPFRFSEYQKVWRVGESMVKNCARRNANLAYLFQKATAT